ncbi:uncharacterized protein TNCV_3606721 [Trichonephila clavipes]|nr:uncharacterized protein TNCV_3606721 [Trichonephila clavipes]
MAHARGSKNLRSVAHDRSNDRFVEQNLVQDRKITPSGDKPFKNGMNSARFSASLLDMVGEIREPEFEQENVVLQIRDYNGKSLILRDNGTDESRVCLQHHDGRIRVWRHRGERMLNSCVMHRHTGPAPGIMVWGGILISFSRTSTTHCRILRDHTWHALSKGSSSITRLHCFLAGLLSGSFADRKHVGPWLLNDCPRLHPVATPDQLWQRAEAAWSSVPQEHIQTLFESTPRHVEEIFNNGATLATDSGRNHTSQKAKRKITQKEKLRIEEREEKLRFEQLRLDEQKRKYEFELEKLRFQLGADTSKESDTKFLVKEISKFIHRFDLKEDISLYLKLFERQAQRLNIDQENWVSHLLGLLPTEVSHIIAREPDDKANSYEHVKDLLLKRFKLTPEKFRQLFVTHQKAPVRTWIDFYHELNIYFNGWIDGLKIDTFNKLSDLIITDQLKPKTPFEFKEYYLDEWANMNSPVQLAEKLEEFEDFKRTLKQKSSSPFVKKQEYRFTEKNRRYEALGKFEYNRKDKKFPASTNYKQTLQSPCYQSTNLFKDIKTARRKGITTKLRETLKSQCFQAFSDELFKIAEIQRTSRRNLHTHR